MPRYGVDARINEKPGTKRKRALYSGCFFFPPFPFFPRSRSFPSFPRPVRPARASGESDDECAQTCEANLPGTVHDSPERKSHCRRNSPSDLTRHWARVGSRRDVANRRQHRSGCASIPPLPTAPRSHQRRYLRLSRAAARRRSPREYVCHAFSAESVSVPPVPPYGPVDLSLRLAPTKSVSLPLDRPLLPSPFHACPCPFPRSRGVLVSRLYISYASTSLFFSSLAPSPFRAASVSLVHTGREIRSNTRGDVPSTPCAVCRRGA